MKRFGEFVNELCQAVPLRIGFHKCGSCYRESLPYPSLLQVREGMRSFGLHKFTGVDTTVAGFPKDSGMYKIYRLGNDTGQRAA